MRKKPKKSEMRAEALQTKIEDDGTALVVDREFKQPAPLDYNIAAVHLHTNANLLSDGYDLQLAASFGQERKTLTSSEFEIEVDFSITKANIVLDFLNCTYQPVDRGEPRTQEASIKVKEQDSKKGSIQGSTRVEVSGSPIGFNTKAVAAARAEGLVTASTITETVIKKQPWYRTGNAVIIGPIGNGPLDGPLLNDFVGWRIFPTEKEKQSAVLARLKVREEWISFGTQIEILKAPPGLLAKIGLMLKSPSKRRCFEVLLKHLTATELGALQDGHEATIAAHILVVRPLDDVAVSLPSPRPLGKIPINGTILERYLKSEEGYEASTLLSIGLPHDVVKDAIAGDKAKRKKRGEDFVPDSSPIHAAAVFEQIHKRGTLKRSEIVYPTTLRDLKVLGLITVADDLVGLAQERTINPQATMRRAVSQMASVQVARSVLRVNPNATHGIIADAVALELGRVWEKKGTKLRNGNAIRRWTVWLEPHLLDPTSSSEAAVLFAYAMDQKVLLGKPASLRNSLEPKLREMRTLGWSRSNMAKEPNVTTTTIGNWLRRIDKIDATIGGTEQQPQSNSSFVERGVGELYEEASKLFTKGMSPGQVANILGIDPELAENFQSDFISARED